MMPLRDAALIAQIDNLTVPRGQVALWALGQAGFVLKGGNTILTLAHSLARHDHHRGTEDTERVIRSFAA
ncbi:MAG: hypothetical protein ACPL89_04210, partial [Roseiflexus castenholzii]